MERLGTTAQREESTKATQERYTMSKAKPLFLTSIPLEIRDMIYDLVLGDHTIHIKSDVIPQKSDDEKHEETVDEEEEDEEEVEEEVVRPAEWLEIESDDRGPLYHRLCGQELLHPRDARYYRIRSLEANGNRVSRVQPNMVINDKLLDPGLEYETLGSLGEEEQDGPPIQLQLAFLRVNKQVYEEASTRLYSTRTFGFDDPMTFAQFFSIEYNYRAEAPTSTNGGTNILATKRNSIRSLGIRAKIALYLGQKIHWMTALDAAAFVLPTLEKIRVLFDLCHKGNERHVDGSCWQAGRHCNSFPWLKAAEVRVASDLSSNMTGDDTTGGRSSGHRDVGWRVQLLEAIVGHHMDVLFGASLLDAAAVAERDAIFDSP